MTNNHLIDFSGNNGGGQLIFEMLLQGISASDNRPDINNNSFGKTDASFEQTYTKRRRKTKMSSQIVPINRINADSKDIWFNAFDYQAGQDANIRWLSRPNLDLIRTKHSNDTEKFRITFDVENFQPEQIKIYIQNRKLTISGVYEERSEGRFMQKQFERTFDIPSNADVDSMASFITENHLLVVEIPLHASQQQIEHLNVNNNDQRRLSFSLNKFNDFNSKQNELSVNPQIRRSSMTKTTTTTTTTGSNEIPAEALELLKSAEDNSTSSSSHTYTSSTTERRSSNVGQTNSKSTNNTLTAENLANLPIEIPPELLASGGTITIQKRKVSVTKGAAEPHHEQSSNTQTAHHLTQPSSTNSSSSSSERRSSKTISSSNQSRSMSLEEFLQNKTWNPTLIDGSGENKKILHMRLQMKPGTTLDQMKISINGHDLRIEVDNKVTNETGRTMNEHSYRQISLFPTCEMDQLKTELKDDGFLHIQVPITLP